MVGGLERFRDHFKEHVHQYALIGGSACDLLMEQAGLTFRATKDLDIVPIVEELDAGFGRSFWQFIRAGQYAVAQSSEGKLMYYRFVSPRAAGFPSMLEVLSIRPEGIPPSEDVHITPILLDEGISSLSAILLQEEYYAFLKAGGRDIHSSDISKHRKDVFRLYQILDPAPRGDVPPSVQADMRRFLVEVRSEPVDLKSLGLARSSLDDVLERLAIIYSVG